MTWTSRSLQRQFICALVWLMASPQSNAQWFLGSLRDSTTRADYIVVTSKANVDAVQPLVTFRASHQSLFAMLVLLDSITSQFPRVTPDSSIRDFVTRTLTHWRAPSPQFLLLAGSVNAVPSHKVASELSTYFGEDSIMVDQWFVNQLTETQETPTPGMAIGRFPAWSTAELATMVGKTIAYEQAPASAWATRSIALVDSTDYTLFESDAASFQRSAAPRWPDTITVHVRSNSPAHRSAGEFRDLWNQGSAFVISSATWGGRSFLRGLTSLHRTRIHFRRDLPSRCA
jgi:hypothetical protein